MWALPDIGRLNADAASASHRALIKKQLQGKKRVDCKFCDQPACPESIQEYYDIFSDDPKGVVGLCEEHLNYYGGIEGVDDLYFSCSNCNRLFVDHYTWERYIHYTEHGETLCVNCRAKEYVEDQDNWIPLSYERICSLTYSEIRASEHVMAVNGPTPEGIKYFDGESQCDTSNERFALEIQKILLRAQSEGYSEAILIMDGAFQFTFSIGVYVRA